MHLLRLVLQKVLPLVQVQFHRPIHRPIHPRFHLQFLPQFPVWSPARDLVPHHLPSPVRNQVPSPVRILRHNHPRLISQVTFLPIALPQHPCLRSVPHQVKSRRSRKSPVNPPQVRRRQETEIHRMTIICSFDSWLIFTFSHLLHI